MKQKKIVLLVAAVDPMDDIIFHVA